MGDHEDIEAWERVAALLSQAGTVEELRADLESQGVNVGEGIDSLRKMVRHLYQAELRERAISETEAMRETAGAKVAEIATWSFAAVLEWLKNAEAGLFGPEIADLAATCHRNKQDKELTESEARSLVSDILSTKK
jgi:predicted transcriptional regulator